MSRHFVALTILTLLGTALVLPDASARPFGITGGARLGGFRAPFAVQRGTRIGPLPRVPGASAATLPHSSAGPGSRPAARSLALGFGRNPGALGFGHNSVAHGLGRNIAPDLRARFVRLHHRGSIAGYIFPFTTEGDDAPYLGTPYDPAEAIPVYAPPSVYPVPDENQDATPSRRLVPRQTSLREENQEACRSERVTVPETSGEGEREIVIVRC